MALFRADEAAVRGFERAQRYLVPREGTASEQASANEAFRALVDELGPVVEAYPSWHPIVADQRSRHSPATTPAEDCGYKGLDHTVLFAHGFVTCPYGDGSPVISSVEKLKENAGALITAERLEAPLYSTDTQAVVVRCDWFRPLMLDKLVPKRVAVGLMLDQEAPGWHWSQFGESWETMRPYLLGQPYGARSSLFVGQETAIALKRVWLALIESGVFGPVKH